MPSVRRTPRSANLVECFPSTGSHFIPLFFILLSLWISDSDATTHPDDIEALLQVQAAINVSSIPPFSCLSTWNFSSDPCDSAVSAAEFFVCGLACDDGVNGEYRRVTSLSIDSPGYQGTLSPFIGNLSGLQELHATNNFFSGEIPEAVGQLGNLMVLDLSGNFFRNRLPLSLGQLSSLRSLILSDNMLEGSIPTTFNNMRNLTHISLFSNKLKGPIPSLDHLSQLSFLDVSFNHLSGPFPANLPPSLLLLSLRNNSLSGNVPGSSVAHLHELSVLDLSQNDFTGHVDQIIFTLPNLEQVNLASNRFSGLSWSNASSSDSQVVALDLSFNNLGGPLPFFVLDMPKLSSLSLRHNFFSGEIPYEYGLKSTGRIVDEDGQMARLWLDGNYLRGDVPSSFLTIYTETSDALVGSFIDNCLQSCPSSLSLCQGGRQKPRAVCYEAYSKISSKNHGIRGRN